MPEQECVFIWFLLFSFLTEIGLDSRHGKCSATEYISMSCSMLFVTTDTCEKQKFIRRSSARLDNIKGYRKISINHLAEDTGFCKLLTEVWSVVSKSKCAVIAALLP